MQQGYLMYILLLLAGVLSTAVLKALYNRIWKEKEKIQSIRSVFFFFLCYYFLISGIKWYLGSAENTLLESFWDADFRTYIHYGIPLMILGILVPVTMNFLFRTSLSKMIGIFDSVMLIGLFFAFIGKGQINNIIFCCVFLIGGLVSIGIILFTKKNIVYLEKEEYPKQLLELLPTVGALMFMVGVYYPNELYLNNLEEFLNPFGELFLILFLGSVLFGAIMLLCVMSLPKEWIRLSNLFLTGLVIMGYLQAMFLNGELEALTGNEQIWATNTKLVNGAIWLLVIGIVCILGYFKALVGKICKGICIYICLIQVVTLGYMVITTDVSGHGSEKALTTQNSLELATDNNVLVFILDMFDSSVLQQLIEEDSSFVEPLSDFTFYRNATSTFGHTKISLPYLLTDTEWKEGLNAEEYHDYAYANSDALNIIAQQECNVGVYTNINYLDESVYGSISNYSESVLRHCNIINTYCTMIRTALYKLVPFTFKSEFTYYTRDIVEMVAAADIWSIENDLPFYNNLIKEGISVNEQYQNAFRFYHMVGAHEPYYLSEDLRYDRTGRETTVYSQAKGCLKIVYEYLRQLKELGKYEEATIIITADHGNIATYDREVDKPSITSLPIMLVKESGKQQDTLKISDAPVSQAEIMPLVMKELGVDNWQNYGRTFEEIGINEKRERFYVDMLDNQYMIQFAINGDANQLDNWRLSSMIFE